MSKRNENLTEKIEWSGAILSIQSRTNVWRYRLDNRTHYHRGWGMDIAMVRDMTDGMYNPAMPPYVSHWEGVRLHGKRQIKKP